MYSSHQPAADGRQRTCSPPSHTAACSSRGAGGARTASVSPAASRSPCCPCTPGTRRRRRAAAAHMYVHSSVHPKDHPNGYSSTARIPRTERSVRMCPAPRPGRCHIAHNASAARCRSPRCDTVRRSTWAHRGKARTPARMAVLVRPGNGDTASAAPSRAGGQPRSARTRSPPRSSPRTRSPPRRGTAGSRTTRRSTA